MQYFISGLSVYASPLRMSQHGNVHLTFLYQGCYGWLLVHSHYWKRKNSIHFNLLKPGGNFTYHQV
jgi:hypothetical protein